jgi:hypothetical protein
MIEVNSFESFHEDDGQKSATQGGGWVAFGSISANSAYPSMNTATEHSLNAADISRIQCAWLKKGHEQ